MAQDGDLISCGHKTVRRHNGATMAFEWSTSVPGFYPSDVIEMSTGRIAAAGYHWSGDPSDPVTLTLVVYTPLGSVLFTHNYAGYDGGGGVLELIETQAGGFMIVCESREPNGLGNFLPFAIMADSSGAELWMKRFTVQGEPNAGGSFHNVIERVDSNGNLLYHLVGKLSLEYLVDDFETLLVTLKPNGTVQQTATIGMDHHTDYGRGLKFIGEAFLVTGYSKGIGEGGGTYLMRVSLGLTVDWYQEIFGFSGTKDIVMAANRVAMLSGTVSFPDPNADVALIGINTVSHALTVGMRYGGGLFEDTGSSFVGETSGYALLGSTNSFGVSTRDEYIIRTNLNGISGCYEEQYTPPLQLMQPIEAEPVLVAQDFVPLRQTQHGSEAQSPALIDLCAGDDPCVCTAPPLDMVGWWTLDEASGIIASDSAANNDGTHVGAPYAFAGKVSNALNFNGITDFVEVPDDSLLDISFLDSFTIDAWIRIDGAGPMAWGPIVDKLDPTNNHGYQFYVHNDTLELTIMDPATQGLVTSSTPVPHNQWVHVAVIADRINGPSFVINGVEEAGNWNNQGYLNLDNSVSLLIGKMRRDYISGPTTHYFDGAIDEVEFFTRALDVSEIQAIYAADACGKCKIDCNPPWDAPFCANDQSIQVVIPVCNNSPYPMTVDLQFAGLTPPTCGGINGPTVFTILSPGNPVVVPGNQCVNVTVEIDRPVQMTSLYNVGCYELTVTDTVSGASSTCRGSVQDRRDLCPLLPDDPMEMTIGLVAAIDIEVVVAEDFEPGVVTWAAVAYGADMIPSGLISINGAEPGSMAMGKFEAEPGAGAEIHLALRAIDFAMGYSDIVLFTQTEDADGQGGMVPLGSFMVSIAPPSGGNEPCPADFNNDGKVDGGDLGLLLSAWGKCEKCAQDLNGDGKVDGGDLGLLLAAWGKC